MTKALEIIHRELDLTMAFCGETRIGTGGPQRVAAGKLPDLMVAALLVR